MHYLVKYTILYDNAIYFYSTAPFTVSPYTIVLIRTFIMWAYVKDYLVKTERSWKLTFVYVRNKLL